MALLHAIVANNEHVLAEASSPDLQNDPEAGNTFSSAVSKLLKQSRTGLGAMLIVHSWILPPKSGHLDMLGQHYPAQDPTQ